MKNFFATFGQKQFPPGYPVESSLGTRLAQEIRSFDSSRRSGEEDPGIH